MRQPVLWVIQMWKFLITGSVYYTGSDYHQTTTCCIFMLVYACMVYIIVKKDFPFSMYHLNKAYTFWHT